MVNKYLKIVLEKIEGIVRYYPFELTSEDLKALKTLKNLKIPTKSHISRGKRKHCTKCKKKMYICDLETAIVKQKKKKVGYVKYKLFCKKCLNSKI